MNISSQEELELIFAAVRKYQHNNIQDVKLYNDCVELLNILYDLTYTQQREQVR